MDDKPKLKQFYLSRHSEIMASKSISKAHRRQDRVLRQEHLSYMTASDKIPVWSARKFENVEDNQFYQKMHLNTIAGMQKTRNTNALYNVSTDMFTTENNSKNSSLFTTTMRSKSIVPQR